MNLRQNSYRQLEDVWRSKGVMVRSLLMSIFTVSLPFVSLPCPSPLSLSLVSPAVRLSPSFSSLSLSPVPLPSLSPASLQCLAPSSLSLSLSLVSFLCLPRSSRSPISLPRLSAVSRSPVSLRGET